MLFKKIVLTGFCLLSSLNVCLASPSRNVNKNQGCVLQSPKENKLKDFVLEPLSEGKFLKGRPLTTFDFSTLSPFPFVPNHERVGYSVTKTSNIVTLLIEFDDPQHNQISKPGQSTTMWVDDFSPSHYDDLIFSRVLEKHSMANYYLENSSGRYTVVGKTFGWFKVPHPESFYGQDKDPESGGHDNANGPVWKLIADAVPSMEKDVPWADYDKVDRYDWDNDGDINEPDGYIDHVMVVHAGEGQEGGGGTQGDNAIWSHRARANFQAPESQNMVGPQNFKKRGGIQVSKDLDLWLLDYTMMPENGDPGVFSHEFGHDLGLPDLYDTQPLNQSQSSVGFWSIMASGSWTALKGEPLGSTPTHFGPWEKMKLGWLDYDEVDLGQSPELHKFTLLDRVEFHGRKAQALKIKLPKSEKEIPIINPQDGKHFAYSGMGHELVQSMATDIDLTSVQSATLKFKTYYDIESDYDYAYVEIENDEGKLVPIPGNITTAENPNGSNLGNGITGNSIAWTDAVFDLTPYVGHKRRLRFRYVTDPAEGGKGFCIDQIEIPEILFKEDFEGTQTGHIFEITPAEWIYNGFMKLEDGLFHKPFTHTYFLEWRTYDGFDRALESVYYYKTLDTVDYYSYAPGLLFWYQNDFYEEGDNRAGVHPGAGSLLVVDSRAKAEKKIDGTPFKPSLQLHDAAFGFTPSEKYFIADKHWLGGTSAMPVFNDLFGYYDKEAPYSSVQLPQVGLSFSLINMSPDRSAAQVAVHYSAKK